MNFKKMTLAILVMSTALFVSTISYGQQRSDQQIMDSVQIVERGKSQQQMDEERMVEAKADKAEAKARSNEAGRIQDEADKASKESSLSLKREKQAQKARKNADKQAKKAQEAREKSDKN